jgi:hypothetical protein
MSRNFVLVFAGICWIGVGLDAAVRLLSGDYLFPAAAGIGFVVWALVFQNHYGRKPAQVPAEVSAEA